MVSIKIAPNPGNGAFKIYSDKYEDVEISIFNSLGQLVKKANESTNNLINFSGDLTTGIYTFVIESSSQSSSITYIVR